MIWHHFEFIILPYNYLSSEIQNDCRNIQLYTWSLTPFYRPHQRGRERLNLDATFWFSHFLRSINRIFLDWFRFGASVCFATGSFFSALLSTTTHCATIRILTRCQKLRDFTLTIRTTAPSAVSANPLEVPSFPRQPGCEANVKGALTLTALVKAFLAKNSPLFQGILASDFKEGRTEIADFSHETISRY